MMSRSYAIQGRFPFRRLLRFHTAALSRHHNKIWLVVDASSAVSPDLLEQVDQLGVAAALVDQVYITAAPAALVQ